MTELAQHGTDYSIVESEDPEVLSRNLSSAATLLSGATAFFFLAFFFAYFYLRAVNNADLWKPKHVDASLTWGTIVTACIVATAILVRLGYADHRADDRPAWRRKGALALAFAVAALALQAAAWTQQGFGPADGGFASVWFGWTAFLWLFVLGTLFWLETVLATSIRYRGWSRGERSVDAADARDIRDPVSLVRAELAALSSYLTFLAGIAVVSWIVLYLV
jgi:heme/copper-type cytochrome/quinol oxidase subunit 3